MDRDTNNFTLFALVEQLQIPADVPTAGTPDVGLAFEVHCYWRFEPDELNRTFTWRVVAQAGAEERVSSSHRLRSETPRFRLRVQGLPLLLEGETSLQVEWEAPDEPGAWHRSPIRWPLAIERRTGAQ